MARVARKKKLYIYIYRERESKEFAGMRDNRGVEDVHHGIGLWGLVWLYRALLS